MSTIITFQELNGALVEVKLDGFGILYKTHDMPYFASIINSFRKESTLKKFPDLKNKPEWRNLAYLRMKNHLAAMKKEDERIQYIIDEMRNTGYLCIAVHKKGMRVNKWE